MVEAEYERWLLPPYSAFSGAEGQEQVEHGSPASEYVHEPSRATIGFLRQQFELCKLHGDAAVLSPANHHEQAADMGRRADVTWVGPDIQALTEVPSAEKQKKQHVPDNCVPNLVHHQNRRRETDQYIKQRVHQAKHKPDKPVKPPQYGTEALPTRQQNRQSRAMSSSYRHDTAASTSPAIVYPALHVEPVIAAGTVVSATTPYENDHTKLKAATHTLHDEQAAEMDWEPPCDAAEDIVPLQRLISVVERAACTGQQSGAALLPPISQLVQPPLGLQPLVGAAVLQQQQQAAKRHAPPQPDAVAPQTLDLLQRVQQTKVKIDTIKQARAEWVQQVAAAFEDDYPSTTIVSAAPAAAAPAAPAATPTALAAALQSSANKPASKHPPQPLQSSGTGHAVVSAQRQQQQQWQGLAIKTTMHVDSGEASSMQMPATRPQQAAPGLPLGRHQPASLQLLDAEWARWLLSASQDVNEQQQQQLETMVGNEVDLQRSGTASLQGPASSEKSLDAEIGLMKSATQALPAPAPASALAPAPPAPAPPAPAPPALAPAPQPQPLALAPAAPTPLSPPPAASAPAPPLASAPASAEEAPEGSTPAPPSAPLRQAAVLQPLTSILAAPAATAAAAAAAAAAESASVLPSVTAPAVAEGSNVQAQADAIADAILAAAQLLPATNMPHNSTFMTALPAASGMPINLSSGSLKVFGEPVANMVADSLARPTDTPQPTQQLVSRTAQHMPHPNIQHSEVLPQNELSAAATPTIQLTSDQAPVPAPPTSAAGSAPGSAAPAAVASGVQADAETAINTVHTWEDVQPAADKLCTEASVGMASIESQLIEPMHLPGGDDDTSYNANGKFAQGLQQVVENIQQDEPLSAPTTRALKRSANVAGIPGTSEGNMQPPAKQGRGSRSGTRAAAAAAGAPAAAAAAANGTCSKGKASQLALNVRRSSRQVQRRHLSAVGPAAAAGAGTPAGAAAYIEVGLQAEVKAFEKAQQKLRRRGGAAARPHTDQLWDKFAVVQAVCKFWRLGRCNKGSECTFAHEGQPITKMIPCRYQASCTKGEACMYSHEAGLLEPCRNMLFQGNCHHHECRFSHASWDLDTAERLKQLYTDMDSRKQLFAEKQKLQQQQQQQGEQEA